MKDRGNNGIHYLNVYVMLREAMESIFIVEDWIANHLLDCSS